MRPGDGERGRSARERGARIGAQGRRRIAVALAVVAAVLLATAAVAGYARYELRDTSEFSARATAALDDADVRDLLAGKVVDAIAGGVRPDVLAVRPLITPAVASLADTAAFRRIFARAVADRHRALFYGRSRVAFDLDYAGTLLRESLRSVSPRVARAIPPGTEPRLIALDADDVRVRIARALENLAGWWWPLLAVGAVLAAGCAVLAGGLRAALAYLGAAVAAAGLTVALLVTLSGSAVVATVAGDGDARARGAMEAVWSAMFDDLRVAALLMALAGIVVTGATVRWPAGALARRLLAAARRDTTAAHLTRGGLLVAAGALALASPAFALRAATLIGGLALVLFGTVELRSRIARAPAPAADGDAEAAADSGAAIPASPLVLAGIVAGVVAAAAIAAMSVLPAPSVPSGRLAAAATPSSGCNGSEALCDRRLDEVVFPSTHNSYAASDEPGWLFPNQRHGIERQLRDGIRGFLIDIHYGQPDPQTGLVRTDLDAEGSDRNKVAQQLSPQALRTADRLAGRIGLGDGDGRPRPYLCHTLCELGAEPLDEQLQLYRDFLDAHPGEVVVLFVEPYVPVEEIERALDRTGLLPEAAELERDEPLPTLGELVAADTRLIVFTERGGGARPWYLDGFSFAQDTPLGARNGAELSCRRWRGTPDSPLLLLNHWIDTFPPSASRNARIGNNVLRKRMAACERERGMLPNLPAVDFYELTGVVRIAHQRNAVR